MPTHPTDGTDRALAHVTDIYDGGVLRHGRLTTLTPRASDRVTGHELLNALQGAGVDLDRFEACAYESDESGGGWLTIEDGSAMTTVPLVPAQETPAQPYPHIPRSERDSHLNSASAISPRRRRVDVKLFRRNTDSREAALADAASKPCGDLPLEGFFGIGVYGAKTERCACTLHPHFCTLHPHLLHPPPHLLYRNGHLRGLHLTCCRNVGTLWRSAYQLGSAFIFTVGHRYETVPTDTLKTPLRLPQYELADWSAFVEFAPRGVAADKASNPTSVHAHVHGHGHMYPGHTWLSRPVLPPLPLCRPSGWPWRWVARTS